MGSAAQIATTGLEIGGGLYSAYSQTAVASARAGYLELLAEQDEGNARLVELAGTRQSRAVQDAAAKRFRRLKRDVRRLEGAQMAILAAKGTAGTVTAEDIARDTENQEALDEAALRAGADAQSEEILRAAGIEAFSLRGRALSRRLGAAAERVAGKRAFIGTLLGTAASVARGFDFPTRKKVKKVPRGTSGRLNLPGFKARGAFRPTKFSFGSSFNPLDKSRTARFR